jgi:hypothetical protein
MSYRAVFVRRMIALELKIYGKETIEFGTGEQSAKN